MVITIIHYYKILVLIHDYVIDTRNPEDSPDGKGATDDLEESISPVREERGDRGPASEERSSWRDRERRDASPPREGWRRGGPRDDDRGPPPRDDRDRFDRGGGGSWRDRARDRDEGGGGWRDRGPRDDRGGGGFRDRYKSIPRIMHVHVFIQVI